MAKVAQRYTLNANLVHLAASGGLQRSASHEGMVSVAAISTARPTLRAELLSSTAPIRQLSSTWTTAKERRRRSNSRLITKPANWGRRLKAEFAMRAEPD